MNTNIIPIQYQEPTGENFSKLVYIDTTDPTTATIFDLNSPPTTNDPALQNNSTYAYIGTNGQTFVWNGTSYITYNPSETTEWRLAGSLTDAKGDKINRIWRNGSIMVGDGVTQSTSFSGYFLARGDFSINPTIFAFQNTNPAGTGMQLSNGAGPNQFLPGLNFTPSGALRAIIGVTVLNDTGFQEPAQQFRVVKNGLNPLTSRPTYEWLNGLGVQMRLTAANNLLIGTTDNPGQERLVVNGAIKTTPNSAYSTAVPNATTPVPNGGAGTIVFAGGRFLGWNGTMWKALDN